MNHSFNVDIAAEVGVEAAIIFENILYWVVKNTAGQENVREGVAWVYNSRAAWGELFPYLGEKQIRNAIERLLTAEFITRDTFSYGSVNRTYWYTLAERAKPYWPKGPKLGVVQKGQTKTDIDNSINSTPPISPKPTKASPRANPRTSLERFLTDTGGVFPVSWDSWARTEFGWSVERVVFEWKDFRDYWTSGNAVSGGLKADWPSTWRTHCRRVSGHKGRGPQPAGNGAGHGGFKRHDHVAAAVNQAMVDLYGVQYTGHGGQVAEPADEACPFGDGPEAIDAVFVDAGSGYEARQLESGGADGGDTDRAGGSALPLEVVSG